MDQAIVLNNAPGGDNFTRATSAYDPYHNVIAAPGVRRRRSYNIGRYRAVGPDLIEGAATNLLAAGSSEHFSLWGIANGDTVADNQVVAPDGETIISSFVESTSTAFHTAAQTITKAGSAIAYTWQGYMQYKASAAYASKVMQLDDGTGSNGARLTFNLQTGAFTSATAFGVSPFTSVSGSVVPWGNGVRFVLTATSNTTTSLRAIVWNNPALSNYAGDGVSGYYIGMQDVKAGVFPTSYISNRNLILFTSAPTNGVWSPSNATATVGQTDPAGTAFGASLLENSSAGTHGTQQSFTKPASSLAMTGSVSVKRGVGTRDAEVRLSDGAGNGASVWINSSTGAVTTAAATFGAGFSAASAVVTASAQGYWRISLTATTNTATTIVLILRMVNAGSDNYTGDGASTLVNAWWQLEYGSAATSYWGTDATVGGRDVDSLTSTYSTGTGSGTLLALVIPYGWSGTTAGSPRFLDDAATTGVVEILASSGASGEPIVERKDASGVQTATASASTLANGVLSQIAMTYTPTLLSSFYNGVAGNTHALTAPLVASTSQVIGNNQSAAAPAYAWCGILAFPRVLAASELLAIKTALPAAA